ncbi:pyridoxamine 5'-phosphate oxidase family protein [Salipiger sp. P9]|uniref:pyridoxine/pyridoxamine 5'-phosphate oxidase n=1 Tax=Salipiger pentaromativorans TaxID=2943193 RepID=UPI0021581041|nr:pyridoxamine 5'-phosphate oxidase family protein [Salipiger pentaromativorans]MCR8546894.1 pyridoxamine 5'-phosphate oxidase family protein [Salipiger pentaromativorans]
MTLLDMQTTNYFPKLRGGAQPMDFATCPDNPLRLMQDWATHVLSIGATEPMFVTLATASATGIPSSRTVQLLDIADDALLFTTNMGSRKGVEILETGAVAVSLYWRETGQSINVTGTVRVADDDENDRRFAQDHREVQASRVVSFHGRKLTDEAAHNARWEELYRSDRAIARPDYWKWFRVVPNGVTFWEGHPDRMNRRLHYTRTGEIWDKSPIEA